MAKNLYNLTAVTTVNDSDLLHVNQGGVSSDKKVTKQNLLKEVNSSITSLNNSLTNSFVTVISASAAVTVTRNNSYRYGNVLFVGVRFSVSSAISIYGNVLQIPSPLRCPTDVYAPLMSSYFTTIDGRGLYLDAASYTFRASSAIPTGGYTFYCPILVSNAS